MLRVALLAVPALVIVTLALDSLESGHLGSDGKLTNVTRSVIDFAARAIIASMILVAWHRVVMLQQAGQRVEPSLGFGARECRYLLVWVALSFAFVGVFAAVVVLITTVEFLAMLALYALLLLVGVGDALVVGQRDQFVIVLWISVFFAVPAASYVAGRLSLVLPALAIDRRRPLRQAWRMSAGNGWRLVASSLLVLVPMEAIATLCSAAAVGARQTAAYIPLATAAAVSLFMLIVLTGTILSLFSLQLDGTLARDEGAYRSGVAVAE